MRRPPWISHATGQCWDYQHVSVLVYELTRWLIPRHSLSDKKALVKRFKASQTTFLQKRRSQAKVWTATTWASPRMGSMSLA